jgi:hypothetical protein
MPAKASENTYCSFTCKQTKYYFLKNPENFERMGVWGGEREKEIVRVKLSEWTQQK